MPLTVSELFLADDLELSGTVPWGSAPDLDAPGIYVVSTSPDPDRGIDKQEPFPGDAGRAQDLLDARSELRLDGRRPSADELLERIGEFWLPDESVLYVGLAGTSVAARVDQYYGTKLGARSPHAGGWFLKTLATLPELHVHYGPARFPTRSEHALLSWFADDVSPESQERARDADHLMPFANLEYPKNVRKAHGITGARAPSSTSADSQSRRVVPRGASAIRPSRSRSTIAANSTQPVTEADIANGQIRVRGPSLSVLPDEKSKIDVILRGVSMSCNWNPRNEGGSRSARLGVPKARLADLVSPGEALSISLEGDSYLID